MSQLLREVFLFFRELLLLEGKFGLALDCEFVVGDLVAELANGVGGVFGGEEAVEMGDYGTIVTLLHT